MRHRLFGAADARARALGAELGAEHLVIGLRHTEQIGDHEQRERARELADELAPPAGDELVELAIGEPPHELLVLAAAASV